MNELLQKHGCSNVFHVPEGLKELMSDISREVLRLQPKRLNDFIANYLSALLITREHGIMSMKILEDLCDCQPTVSEHLLQLGLVQEEAAMLSKIIKEVIEEGPDVDGKDKVKEYTLVKKILKIKSLDEEMSAKVCQVARNAYRDYWYRKNLLKQGIMMADEEPWQVAARNTLELYKKTKPSLTELHRATERIQAAYRGYHVRRHVLTHLRPKKDKRQGRKVDLSGPPLDIAGSRDAKLGPMISIRNAVKEDNVAEMFDKEAAENLGLEYNPMKTITNVEDTEFLKEQEQTFERSRQEFSKSKKSGLSFKDTVKKVESEDKFEEEISYPRVSQIPSVVADRIASQSAQVGPGRISFSDIPPEIIEVPEETLISSSAKASADEIGEVDEDITDIADDLTDTRTADTTVETDTDADGGDTGEDVPDEAEEGK